MKAVKDTAEALIDSWLGFSKLPGGAAPGA